VLFFFFQAEDGIRDFHVTGVQTCALPISLRGLDLPGQLLGARQQLRLLVAGGARHLLAERLLLGAQGLEAAQRGTATPVEVEDRSEERRVGKEGGTRQGGEPLQGYVGGAR